MPMPPLRSGTEQLSEQNLSLFIYDQISWRRGLRTTLVSIVVPKGVSFGRFRKLVSHMRLNGSTLLSVTSLDSERLRLQFALRTKSGHGASFVLYPLASVFNG